jgi:diguanylate cyclase (GGDEF)-like protein/excisionase family DNA binding protein
MSNSLHLRPIDATLSVTKAARLLGVHPNTVRTWSDAGRLRYFRINARGDRRYRLGDLQRFLAAAEPHPTDRPAQTTAAVSDEARRPGIRGGPKPAFEHAGLEGQDVAADPLDAERHRLDLSVVSTITRLAGGVERATDPLLAAIQALRDAYGHHLVAIWEARGELLVRRAATSANAGESARLTDLPRGPGVLGAALDAGDGRARRTGDGRRTAEPEAPGAPSLHDRPVLRGGRPELAVPIPGGDAAWGVLLIVGEDSGSLAHRDLEAAQVAADGIAALVKAIDRAEEIAHLRHRADVLRRVASDIGSRLDLDRVLSGLVDHALVLFEGDRAAVFLERPDGQITAVVSRGLSNEYLNSVRALPARTLLAAAVAAGRPLFSVGYRDDPRGAEMRAAVVQEGFDTLCSAPLLDGGSVLGQLNVYHDRPHRWTEAELETVEALAAQVGVAIRAAQDYGRMSTWAAQLQSIQQLGARLNRLSSVSEIGMAIATELRQLIDYHNARVYRLVGQELIPVAMQGQIGEYVDETPDQLRVTIGEGITGWVAANRIAQNLGDAASDPRVRTVPGTEANLDESMLLAPMLFDDQVQGVLVLSKLGLHRFTEDDLRLLVIYASLAAQAMANAETNERLRDQGRALERQLRSQRELLQITESLLTTLDAQAVLNSITDGLGRLIGCDNISIELVDPATGLLSPLTARGVHAAYYLEPWESGETGVATWVVEHDEPVHIRDERDDPRVNQPDEGSEDGSLIVVPLRSRAGAIGVLTIERLGVGNSFSYDEFELVQLFAAQVSIALQNAEVFQAVQVRARTDGLTGLLNHATFQEWLDRMAREGGSFSLIMLDLDNFREVNNGRGHQAGDEVLRRIGASLVRAGRETDLVFRYGGDEFAYLLPRTDQAGAVLAAERARQAVRSTDNAVSASVGLATFPSDGATAAELLLAADRACFVAKRDGRDRVATAAEGLALAAEFSPQAPTPVDSTSSPEVGSSSG